MFGLSPAKLLLIALILLLIFGASRLSDIGKGLGEGIRNFKRGIRSDEPDDQKSLKPKRKKKSDG